MEETGGYILCTIMDETLASKKETKRKISIASDLKFKILHADLLPTIEAGLICTIDGEMFFSFTKNMFIGDLDTSCHITDNDSGLYDVFDISELVQCRLGSVPATKKGKLCLKVWQVDMSEKVHVLWHVTFCVKAIVNLFWLAYKLLQGTTILSDHKNNIVV